MSVCVVGEQADGLPVVCIRATLLINSEFTLRASKLMNILQGSLETENSLQTKINTFLVLSPRRFYLFLKKTQHADRLKI